jgi:hypothetical protein
MQPIDSEYEYIPRKESNPRARFNWLYIIPALGLVWVLWLASAAIFQYSLSNLVDPILGFMIILFFVMAGLFFYALAPRERK